MRGVIAQLQQMGKQRTSETYRCTLKGFIQFRENKDVLLEDIDSNLLMMYEAYLHNIGLSKNVSLFILQSWNVIYRYGVSQEERPIQWHTIISQTQDRTTTLYSLGEMYAGDCGVVRYFTIQLSITHHQVF